MTLRQLLSTEQKAMILTLLYSPWVIRDFLFCLLHGLRWNPDWRFYGLPIISKRGAIIIGNKFIACSDPRHNSLGVFQRVTIKTLAQKAIITIGDNVGVSGCTLSAATSITIGNHVLLGSGCLITDFDAYPIDPEERRLGGAGLSKPIVIEDDVFVGARAIILKGVTIGKGSVVGAGAVVAKSVPPYSIVVGNPAKVVGSSIKNTK